MAKTEKQITGTRGEEIASKYLIHKGYNLLERNYRWKRAEVDIIAQFGNTLIFIEVKTRKDRFYGNPEDFVTEKKCIFLLEAAQHYAMTHTHSTGIRIDAIGIILLKNGQFDLTHFEDIYFPTF